MKIGFVKSVVSSTIPPWLSSWIPAFLFPVYVQALGRALPFSELFEMEMLELPYPWHWQSNTNLSHYARASYPPSLLKRFESLSMVCVDSHTLKKYFSLGDRFCPIQPMIWFLSWQSPQAVN